MSEGQFKRGDDEWIEPPKPWWNDGDKVGGIAATITVIGLAILVACVFAGIGVRLFHAIS